MAREPGTQRVGTDVGIAVHVAANPGAEAQGPPAPRRYLDVVLAAHGLLEFFVERRHDAVDDVRQIEEHVLQLVHHRGPGGGLRIGLPGGGDLLADPRQRGALFIRRARRIEPLDQQPADHLLLFEHGAPGRFGGVRGEDRLDAQPLEQRRGLGRCDAGGGEPPGHVGQTALLRIAGAAQIVAAAPDAVNPLGEIDDFEVGGKRPDQRLGIVRRQAA